MYRDEKHILDTSAFYRKTSGEIEAAIANETQEEFDSLADSYRRQTDELAAVKRERDAAVASEKAYQTPMHVLQPEWDDSKCPRCGESFYPDYETCDDGYYDRPIGLERCPYCGQKLMWNAPTGTESEADK